MLSFIVAPQVLLHILASDISSVGDEVGNIEKAFLISPGVVKLKNRAGYDIDITLSGERPVLVQVDLPTATCFLEARIMRDPAQ